MLFKGSTEAVGTYQVLRELDLEFAKQLYLGAEDMEVHHSISHVNSKTSLASTKRQNSEISEQV